jgi:hypothetical protein
MRRLPGSFFGSEDPIGKHFGQNATASSEFEVVGVAKDARYLTNNLDKPSDPFFFLPEAQADYTKSLGSLFLRDIVIVTKPGAGLSSAKVRQALGSVDPGLPIMSIRTLQEKVDLQFTQQRPLSPSFFGCFLVLADRSLRVIAQNTNGGSMGWRAVALGATRGDVVRLVLKDAAGRLSLDWRLGCR